MPIVRCPLLDDLDEQLMQRICGHFYTSLTAIEEVEAILENNAPPSQRMQYVCGLWRLKKLRHLRTLQGCDRLDKRVFAAEYEDWFNITDFAYVFDDLDTYDWATGANMDWVLG